MEEIALGDDMGAFGEVECVDGVRELAGLNGAIEQGRDACDRLFDELALVGADEGITGCCGSECDPNDRFFAAGVIVG